MHPLLKKILDPPLHTAKIEIRLNATNGRLQEIKNNRKSSTFRPKKCSRSLTGTGRLLEVPPVRLCLGNSSWCLGLAVAYGRWSHMEVRLYVRDTGCFPFTQTTWVEVVCINIMMAKVFYLFTSFALSFHPQSTNVSEGFYNIIAAKLNIHWPRRLFMYFIFTNSSTTTFPSRCLS